LLFSTGALSVGTKPDFEPIENLCKWVLPVDDSWGDNFWAELGFKPSRNHTKIPRAVKFRDYHMTSKSGPNGQALITNIADLEQLRKQPELLKSVYIVGGERLEQRVSGLLEQFDFLKASYPEYPSHRLRKISWLPDKEVKVRVVGILDYFSQAALKPLHHYLYRILRRIPQDCTFDQGSFLEKTKAWEMYYSIDLTAATDRFPIHFISSLLRWVFPQHFVSAWEYIMIGLPFEYKGPGGWKSIRYSCGNPMGAYTSWASFALAHHFVVYQSCKDIGISWSEAKYALLGDDLLIGDKRLADAYKYRITRLGVEFSPLKTHESKRLYEFAKRLFWDGTEISPFPIRALWVSQKYYDLLPVLYGELNKGWNVGLEVSKVIESYYQVVKGFNASSAKKIYDKAAVCEQLMLYMRGLRPAIDVLVSVYRQQNKPFPDILGDMAAEEVVNASILNSFTASDPQSPQRNKGKAGKPLGLLAESIVLRLTGSEDETIVNWACEHISRVPVLNVYGQVTEMYLALKRTGLREVSKSGVWPPLLTDCRPSTLRPSLCWKTKRSVIERCL
jgi:hypothetical protein